MYPSRPVLAADQFEVPVLDERLLGLAIGDAIALTGFNGEFTFSADVLKVGRYGTNSSSAAGNL